MKPAAGIRVTLRRWKGITRSRKHPGDSHLSIADYRKVGPVPVQVDAIEKPDGYAVAGTGYPLMNLLPITARGYIGGYTRDMRGISQMVLDRAAWPGGSGSPVYDARGKVLGIVLATGEARLPECCTRKAHR